MSTSLEVLLHQALAESPGGLSAKQLVRRLDEQHGLKLTKSCINPILYRERDRFVFDGYSPPVWFLRQAPAVPVPKPPPPPATERAPIPPPAVRRVVPFATPKPVAPRTVPPREPGRLYPWQEQAIAAWDAAGGRGIVEAVTGTGKSRIAARLVERQVKSGGRTLVLVPSVVLRNQWSELLEAELGLTVTSFVGGGTPSRFDPECPVTIATVQSFHRRAPEFRGQFDLLVADECHRFGAKNYRAALLASAPLRIGLTATLEREDGADRDVLAPYFGGVCYQYGYDRAKRDEVIAPFGVVFLGVDLGADEQKAYDAAGQTMTRSRLRLVKDFGVPSEPIGVFHERVSALAKSGSNEGSRLARAYLAARQRRSSILSESPAKLAAIERLRPSLLMGKQTIVFTETVEGADRVVTVLDDGDLSVAALHNGVAKAVFSADWEQFKEGSLRCAVAVHCLEEGADVREIDLGIVVAGSRSRRQFIQRVGRVLRRKKDGRGAVFAVIYAKGSAEDPFVGGRDEVGAGHWEELLRHADWSEICEVGEIDGDWLAGEVRQRIWGPAAAAAN